MKRLRNPDAPIATFADLLRTGEKRAWVHCNNRQCARRVAMPFAPFAIRWGLDAPVVPAIRRAFLCSRYGDKTSTLSLIFQIAIGTN